MKSQLAPPVLDAVQLSRLFHRPISRCSLLALCGDGAAALFGLPGYLPRAFKASQREGMLEVFGRLARAYDDQADGIPEAAEAERKCLELLHRYQRTNAHLFSGGFLQPGEWMDQRALPTGYVFDAGGFPVKERPRVIVPFPDRSP
ncbi:MAG: hypothetical protein K5Q68_03350 [Roseococcus sp.]|nr:hypothetical protein [Roseococcus sp.]